ncbi:MAG TPA: hypothetical protein PKA64_06720, partial [Myxococcota bacterium]|nr:hypothetical protein [Myxococcota bacterium]
PAAPAAAPPATAGVTIPPAALPIMLALSADLNPSVEVNGVPLPDPSTMLTAGSYHVRYSWEPHKTYELDVTLTQEGGQWEVLAGDAHVSATPGKRVVLTADPSGRPKLDVQAMRGR